MANYIRYLFKTVRKFYGEAVVVTQEVDDIISSPVVKETIINNSDCKILLDQRKYQNKFDQIQNLLGLTDKELDLLNKRFIVFELDVVKDNPILFPVVTIIIMETFINKMRRLQGIRKMILIEEA